MFLRDNDSGFGGVVSSGSDEISRRGRRSIDGGISCAPSEEGCIRCIVVKMWRRCRHGWNCKRGNILILSFGGGR